MVSTSSRIWITFSALIFGKDTTQSWRVMGLVDGNDRDLGIILILAITFLSSRG